MAKIIKNYVYLSENALFNYFSDRYKVIIVGKYTF